jgi:outer membrane lipoprotein carrier protein
VSPTRRRAALALAAAVWLAASGDAHADGVARLREFASEVKGGEAPFTQTVTSADASRRKVSTGNFSFLRPNRFRFAYAKPFEQLIVADGTKVWIHDPDLNQASSRKLAAALGATPVAILAGGSIEQDFDLEPQAARDGVEWVLAKPKRSDGPIQSVRIGFRAKELAVLEIADAFGQRSLLQFSDVRTNVPIADSQFRFTPPPGTDVIEQ